MAWLVFFIYISGRTRSCNFIVSGSFQLPYTRAPFHLNKSFHRCIAGTAGIKPGPPGQQASVLSITPLPFGQARLDKSYNRDINLICFRVSTKINKCGKNNLFSVNPKPATWSHTKSSERMQGLIQEAKFSQLQHVTGFKPLLGSDERSEFSTGHPLAVLHSGIRCLY